MNGEIIIGDCVKVLTTLKDESFQAIIADPPYFQVLLGEDWDNQWRSEDEYLAWFDLWVELAARKLKQDGLFFIFGQLGKREHAWLHACSRTARQLQFHDMLIWDRAVGYNERYDSFTPCYEMVLVLRKSESAKPYFNKDVLRVSYDEETIQNYMRDKRYKDRDARREHLEKGKYATNILRVPSLKGSSKEKIGHPSQKPLKLIQDLVACSTRKGDQVLDPFLGSGTTAAACENLERRWVGIETQAKYAKLAESRIKNLAAEMALFNEANVEMSLAGS